MKTEFAIWLVSYLIRRGPDTQENIINEWSKYINEDVEIHRNTFVFTTNYSSIFYKQ